MLHIEADFLFASPPEEEGANASRQASRPSLKDASRNAKSSATRSNFFLTRPKIFRSKAVFSLAKGSTVATRRDSSAHDALLDGAIGCVIPERRVSRTDAETDAAGCSRNSDSPCAG
jgi:hypothetical protein